MSATELPRPRTEGELARCVCCGDTEGLSVSLKLYAFDAVCLESVFLCERCKPDHARAVAIEEARNGDAA